MIIVMRVIRITGLLIMDSIVIEAISCKLSGDYSQKMRGLATGPLFAFPLKSFPIGKWNALIGSPLTATIEIIHAQAADLNNDEVWMEFSYLGTSGFLLSSLLDDWRTWFGTAAAQDASTATWTEDLTWRESRN